MNRLKWLPLLVCVAMLLGFADRPRDPWVFRCVLDQKPRMVVLALHESLYAAFDATNCSLYKAWKGDVKFQGAVYDSVHGPQPVVRGDVLLATDEATPWTITQHGNTLHFKTIWRGYRIENDRVTLLYELQTEKAGSLGIEERVDVANATAETAQLVREVTTRSVPPGIAVSLAVPCAQVNDRPVPVEVDGKATTYEPGARTQTVALKSNSTTTISTTVRFTPKNAAPATDAKGAER